MQNWQRDAAETRRRGRPRYVPRCNHSRRRIYSRRSLIANRTNVQAIAIGGFGANMKHSGLLCSEALIFVEKWSSVNASTDARACTGHEPADTGVPLSCEWVQKFSLRWYFGALAGIWQIGQLPYRLFLVALTYTNLLLS